MGIQPYAGGPPVQTPAPVIPSGFGWSDDFLGSTFGTTDGAATYDYTSVNSGTVGIALSTPGGAVVMVNGTTAGNHEHIVRLGENYQTAAQGRQISFAIRCKVEDADQNKLWAGLHEYGTLDSDRDVIAESVKDGVGFYQDHATAGTPTLKCVVGNATAQDTATCYDRTGAAITLADDTWIELGFRINDRDFVEFYVNGHRAAVLRSSYIPTNALALLCMNEALDTGGDDFFIDFWSAHQSSRG